MGFLKMLVERLLGNEGNNDKQDASALPLVERRSSVRLSYEIELMVQLQDESMSATLVNLTFTGLSFTAPRELAPGLELTLVRDDLGPSFSGTVQWCRKEAREFLVGFECELDEVRLADSWLLPALEEAGFRSEFANEQRKLIRHAQEALCILSDGKGITYYDVSMLDLSLGGALVVTHQELTTGDRYKFRTEKPGFSCQSIVRSAHQRESGWHCSLEFEDPPEQELKAYLSS